MYVKVAWQHSADELQQLYRAERDGKRRQRLHALWLLREGTRTMAEVGAVVGSCERSVQRWLDWYRAGGLPTLDQHRVGHAGGVIARLSLEEQALLAAYAADGEFRTIDEVRQWVTETCGVRFTYFSLRGQMRQAAPRGIAVQQPKQLCYDWVYLALDCLPD